MLKNPFSLEGKEILVTGASSGIGRFVAIASDRLSGKVSITGRNSMRLDETFQMMQGSGRKKFICDLTSGIDLDNLVGQLPNIDGVVFCAGIIDYTPGKFISEEKIRNIFNLNFDSQILLYQKLHRSKKINKRASLIFISSVSSHTGVPGTIIYASSKAAINASVRVLASELSPMKIRVNSISPGIIRTPMVEGHEHVIDNQAFEIGESQYPLGYGTVDDVAYAVTFLLSDASRWITGIDLKIDGGLTLK